METKVKIKMMATKMTAEQVKADAKREYNPSSWERMVDGYQKYGDVEFYKVDEGNGYDYSRFFVVYTLAEGLRLLGSLSYSSAITSGGFFTAYVREMDDQYNWYPNGQVQLVTRKISFINSKGENEEGTMNTSKEARAYMTKMSKERGQVWTKEYFFN